MPKIAPENIQNIQNTQNIPNIPKTPTSSTIVTLPPSPRTTYIHYATALNILSIYMRGQKILHVDSKSHCERRLNMLMLPAIVNSATCTVLSVALKDLSFGPTILAGLTAFNSCVLALISYLKLDAKSEAHKSSAYQFDKLQNLCEFHAGKFIFSAEDEEDKQKFVAIMNEIETKVKEIKDSNQFILPTTIRRKYPLIYTTNVFAEVRQLQHEESVLEEEYKNLTGEEKKNKATDLAKCRKKYFSLDNSFKEEIRQDTEPSCLTRIWKRFFDDKN